MSGFEKLFVYGTLRDGEIQKNVFGRVTDILGEKISGWKKSEITIQGENYLALVPEGNSIIEGAVIEVTPEELKKIDKYETSAYQRIKVSLSSGESAWVYIKGTNEKNSNTLLSKE